MDKNEQTNPSSSKEEAFTEEERKILENSIRKDMWEQILGDALAYLETKPLFRNEGDKTMYLKGRNEGYDLARRTLEKFKDEAFNGKKG